MTADVEDVIAWHEGRRDYHMMLARGFRRDLDRLQIEDPEEYQQWDRDSTIGEQVHRARWHNRVAWLARWTEETTPKQATLL